MRALSPSLLLLALLACAPTPESVADGRDPIAALGVSVPTHKYDTAYWARQADRHSHLWLDAKTYCSGRQVTLYPNCAHVDRALFWEAPPSLPPLPLAPLRRALSALPPPPPRPRP